MFFFCIRSKKEDIVLSGRLCLKFIKIISKLFLGELEMVESDVKVVTYNNIELNQTASKLKIKENRGKVMS